MCQPDLHIFDLKVRIEQVLCSQNHRSMGISWDCMAR